jgi:hypothetical protein
VRRAYLLALLVASCKDAPPTKPNCTSLPDFEILVSAVDAPLPPDTVVSIEYGGGVMEYYSLAGPSERHVLFCDVTDREGNPVTGAGGQAGQVAGGAGAGEGPADPVEALHCELWTDGPATVTVETTLYPTAVVPLHAKKDKCTVSADIELGPDDGGA